jgi:hypothetical protein
MHTQPEHLGAGGGDGLPTNTAQLLVCVDDEKKAATSVCRRGDACAFQSNRFLLPLRFDDDDDDDDDRLASVERLASAIDVIASSITASTTNARIMADIEQRVVMMWMMLWMMLLWMMLLLMLLWMMLLMLFIWLLPSFHPHPHIQ